MPLFYITQKWFFSVFFYIELKGCVDCLVYVEVRKMLWKRKRLKTVTIQLVSDFQVIETLLLA